MLTAGNFSFGNFLLDVFSIFVFVGSNSCEMVARWRTVSSSTALSIGTESAGPYGSFHIHQLSVEAGGLRLTATERVSVS